MGATASLGGGRAAQQMAAMADIVARLENMASTAISGQVELQLGLATALGPEKYLELRQLEIGYQERMNVLAWTDMKEAAVFLAATYAERLMGLAEDAGDRAREKTNVKREMCDQVKALAKSGDFRVKTSDWETVLTPIKKEVQAAADVADVEEQEEEEEDEDEGANW
tara:strand:- start:659 stop:1162 length:504 start_codon:yes stop_codon:yes gene_type:complete